MANYYQNADGTTSTKLKGRNFVQQNDGTTIESGINNINVKSKKKQKKDSFSTAINKLGDVVDNSSVKNRGLSFSNAVTDLANLYDASKNVAKSLPVVGNLFKAGEVVGNTLTNTATNLGVGALKGIEGTADFVSDVVVNPIERGINYGIDYVKSGKKVADENLKDLKKMQQRDIKRDLTKEFQNKVGYSDIVDDLEKNSLVRRDNLGGQVAQAIGGMVPALVTGQAFASAGPVLKSTEGLTGLNKAKTIAGNMGKSFAAQLPSTAILGTSSYGSGVEDALNNGATLEQARLYGIGNSAKEMATEWITGGIPGLGGKGGLDLPIEKLINKTTGKIKNEYAKAFAKTLANYGYKFLGEGIEEGLSEILDPYLKNATYSNGEKVNWQEVFSSFIVGGLTGGILEAPNTVVDFKNNMVEAKNNIQQNKVTLPVAELNAVNKNNNEFQNDIEGNPLVENNSQVSLPLDSNTVQKMSGVNQNQENFVYESSPNSKIDNFRRSANQFMNNSLETKGFVQTVEKVINDKDYNIIFDSALGDNVNGRIGINDNGEVDIRINPNSDRAGEFILTHEITHAIDTQEMQNLVIDYASKNSEFNESLEALKQTYGVDNVNDEVLADISGRLFGNEEFINNLSTSKPNIFKRIYDKIISIANKITGNSKENLFIKDLKNKWEAAYRNTTTEQVISNLNNGDKYHTNINISKHVDNILNNINERDPVKLRDYTPDILVQNGIKNLPMYENPSHIRKNILTEQEAIKLGLSVGKNDHYHGLGKDLYIKAIDSLDEPRVIFKRNNSNDYLILTTLKDNGGNNIVVPIEVETSTNVNRIKIDINRVKTVYGYDIQNPDLNNYIKFNLNRNEFSKIYEQKKEQGTGNSTAADSFLEDNISQYNTNVNSNTSSAKYSMQENINNTQELENSSFSLNKNAKQYDDLIKTNYIEYFRKDNGDVKVYLIDSNNNVINEFSLWSSTNAIKELGEKLGNKIYETATDTTEKINIGNDINNLGIDTDYFMNHRPSEGYGNASDFEANMPDIFEHPEWYLNLDEKYNKESLSALKKVRNNPEAEITIYRATIGDKINPGDWVTPSKKYAQEHLKRSLNGNGNIVEQKVKAKDILFAGDDINEFGYFPESEKYSKKNGSWQEFVERNFKSKGTRTNFENTRLNINNTEKNLINKGTEKITKKYEREKNKNKKIITKEASKILEFDDYQQKRKFTDLVSEYYDNPDLNKIKQDIKENFSEKRIEYVNDYVKDIKNVIRGTDLQITDYVRKNLTDFGNFRKENFNKLKLKNQGQSIDSFYNELSEDYPSVFSKNITDEVDQLERLSEFMNEDDKFYEKYKLDDNVINEAAQYVYDSIKNKDNIDDLINSISISPKQIRKEKTVEYREYARNFLHNSANWIDKKLGLSYKTKTMKRNFYDVMGKKDGERLYHGYIETIFIHNAQMQEDIESYNNKIKKLNLNDKESIAVQMFGEYKYNPETLVTGMEVDEFITQNKLDYKKIENAVETLRATYDELLERRNEIRRQQGIKEVEYRKGYFPHFVENKPSTKIGKFMEKMGWKFNDNSVPTDIAGITDTFKPIKSWSKSEQRRLGKYTDYNALKGFDSYVRESMEDIYFIEDIQKLRSLENEIRYQHSEKGVQTQIDEIMSDDSLAWDDRQDKIDKIYAKYATPLSNLVSEIRDYTNALTNKKSILDRTMEQATNRKMYSVMQNVSNRLSANMVACNLSSAITNFIPITQATSQVKSKYLIKGLREAVKNQVVADNFESKSVFLTSRLKEADRLYKTKWEKASDKASVIFDGIDSITANTIVRGKYYENIAKGMSEYNARRNADEFARDLMAGRTKGEMPTIFNSKNPLVKLFTSFQLEVNNQYQYMFKDLPRDLADEGKNKLVSAFIKMFFGAWIYNQLTEPVVGRKSAFSPVDTIKEVYDTIINPKIKTSDKTADILENLTQDIPFVGGLIGGGRLPISSAANPIKIFRGESTVKDEAKKAFYYTVLPFGGGQLKKTIEGASMYVNDKKIKGSYTSKGQLRFEAEKNPAAVAQALLFGQYSSKDARQYFDNSYSPLTDKQLKEVEKMDISVNKYRKYQDDKKEINKIKSDKDHEGKTINGSASGKKAFLIMNSNFSRQEKNYLLSKIGNSEVKVSDLEQLPNDKKIYKFYFGLNKDSKKDFVNEIKNYNVGPEDLYNYYSKRQILRREYTSGFAKKEMVEYIKNSKFDEKTKWYLYNKDYGSDISELLVNTFGIKTDDYFNTMEYADKIAKDYPNTKQASIRKRKVFEYINNLKCSQKQKIVLFSRAGYSTSEFKNSMYTYIKGLKLTQSEKEKIWNSLY